MDLDLFDSFTDQAKDHDLLASSASATKRKLVNEEPNAADPTIAIGAQEPSTKVRIESIPMVLC